MNFIPLKTDGKFKLSEVVEKICSQTPGTGSISLPQINNEINGKVPAQKKVYKTRDKWIRLTTRLPQAVFSCMTGDIIMHVIIIMFT